MISFCPFLIQRHSVKSKSVKATSYFWGCAASSQEQEKTPAPWPTALKFRLRWAFKEEAAAVCLLRPPDQSDETPNLLETSVSRVYAL